jgi:protein involved in polysaccharide export with SLBB domain
MNPKYLLLLLLLLFGALAIPAASTAQEVSTIKVSDLTDAQIKQLLNEVSKLGLSMEEAAQMARLRGASETQIKELMGRMLAINLAAEKDTLNIKAEGRGQKAEGGNKEEVSGEKEGLSKKRKKEVDSLGVERKIFGFELFNSDKLTFEPSVNIQTPKEYIIGIGDEFIINVWGASEAVYQSKVDKNGSIRIPQIGPVYVNGLSFDAAEALIRKRLISIHNGLGGSNPNTYAVINLGGLRSIQITVLGEVMAPGTYTLPATASLFNALYLSGGPNKNGSLRNIRLIRKGEIHKQVDIYNFLVNADASDNVPLRDQDIVFIPTFEKRVIVGGEFIRTGLFEMKSDETLSSLIRFTGGFTDKAFKSRVFVYHRAQAQMEVRDIESAVFDRYILEGGDSVTAGPILERYANRVKIGGAVFRPGSYELSSGLTLKELITKAEGLTEDAYLNRGQIFRLSGNNDTLALAFNVTRVMEGTEKIELQREDSVSIKNVRELREEYFVEIQGEVNDPGKKSFYQNMTAHDLIYLAGGFKEDADIRVIEISRRLTYDEAAILNDSLGHVFTVSLPRDLKPGEDDSRFILQPFDVVSVRRAQGFRDQGSVAITGEVLYAGFYSIKNRQNRISDLIKWSGGLTPDAYVDAAKLFKLDSIPVGIDLQKIISNSGSRLDMILEPGDSLHIPKEPQTVNIIGQVQKPFATTFIPNKGVKYYVKNAGGWAESAAKRRIYVTYPDGSSDNTKSFFFHRYPVIKPGSTIFIPKEPDKGPRPDRSAFWLAAASTMSSVALTVVTILNMLKN